MRKTAKKLLFPALGLLLALSACTPPPPEPTPSPTPTSLPTPTQSAAPSGLVWRDQVFEERFTAEDGAALVTVQYLLPGVVNAGDNLAWAAIDDYYRIEGESYMATARETAVMAEGDREATTALGYDFNPLAEESYYSLTLQDEEMVSFRRTYYSDWGGAYPAIFQFSEQFRLSDGKRIFFADLFPDTESARQKIFAAVKEQIALREDADVFDIAKVESSFQEDYFYLTADSVVFYYPETDLALHGAGIPEFVLPRAALGI